MTISERLQTSVCIQEEESVRISDISWDTEQQALTIGNMTVTLTATEYRLLLPLRHGTPVTYADLAAQAYNYVVDEKVRVMMDKHIDRIRGKLRGTGIYIYCVLNYGYLLLPEASSYHDPLQASSRRPLL